MPYSNNPGRCRIDLFRETGKWYATGSVDLSAHYNAEDMWQAVLDACTASMTEDADTPHEGWPVMSTPTEWLAQGGTIVCLEPYHKHSHPLMLTRQRLRIAAAEHG